MEDREKIVAIALLTREEVRWLGSSLKQVYRADASPLFEELIEALDRAGPASAAPIEKMVPRGGIEPPTP